MVWGIWTIMSWHLLVCVQPLEQQQGVVPDPDAEYRLFDRVVNIRESFTVPLGLRGTIIGIKGGEISVHSLVLFESSPQLSRKCVCFHLQPIVRQRFCMRFCLMRSLLEVSLSGTTFLKSSQVNENKQFYSEKQKALCFLPQIRVAACVPPPPVRPHQPFTRSPNGSRFPQTDRHRQTSTFRRQLLLKPSNGRPQSLSPLALCSNTGGFSHTQKHSL